MARQYFDYTGVVEEVGQTQSFGSNGFTKRSMIVGNDIDSQSTYPNPVQFTFKKDNTSLLDGISKGQRVKVRFAVEGRRWDGPNGVRYFIDLVGTKVEVMNADGSSTEPLPSIPEPDFPADAGDVDDMPF